MLLLMVRLGLRANDVAGLRWGAIHWQESTLVVCGQSRRATRFPLPQEVGAAILPYVTDARPRPPTRPPSSSRPWRRGAPLRHRW